MVASSDILVVAQETGEVVICGPAKSNSRAVAGD
jgi:hypothetical protein